MDGTMMNRRKDAQEVPFPLVGGNGFGRYPIISSEQTFNMIESDGWLVDYAGYAQVASYSANGKGRGNFRSTQFNFMLTVINNIVYIVNTNLTYNQIGQLDTFIGDVFIAEDRQGHIGICDKNSIWIYTPSTGTFAKATVDGTNPLDFIPGYIAFHNGRFISVDLNSAQWRLSDPKNNNSEFPNSTQFVGNFSGGGSAVAVVPIPSTENNIFVMGLYNTELWTDQGLQGFPYVRNAAFGIDYGTVNAATVDYLDNMVCWVAQNTKSGPFVVMSNGGPANPISTDGIDFNLSKLTNPSDSIGFMFRQDGHIFYQFTFPTDNLSYVYDFKTNQFSTLTDANMNYHPAKHVAFFNNTYYFVSLNDSNLYELSTAYSSLDGDEMPRIRINKTFRLGNAYPFVADEISFFVESGESDDIPRLDFSVSEDGGVTFSNFDNLQLNSLGNRQYAAIYNNLGRANQLTIQIRYYGLGRAVLGNGTLVYHI